MEQPMITPSTDAQWREYYQKKANESDLQVKDLAWAVTHLIRLGMEGKQVDIYMLGQRIARRLKYPRDKEQVAEELKKWKHFAGSILREEVKNADKS